MNAITAKLPAPQDVTDVDSVESRREAWRPAKVGLWVVAVGLGGFLLWAALAPLDEGVPAQGQVTIDTKSKAVQHQLGGIVTKVMVREGDRVKEGQPLFELDTGAALANHQQVRQQYLSQLAAQSRLRAEQSGLARIVYSPELVEAQKTDPAVQSQMQTQDSLLRARRGALAADLSSMQESIRGQEATIQAGNAVLDSRRQQLALLREELSRTAPLVADGYAPKNRLLELDRQAADSVASQADTRGQIARAQQSIAEIRQRMVARQQEARKEIETQLADVSGLVEANRSRVASTGEELARTEIRSPANGQVVGLAVQSVGAVIAPGQKLLDVSPNDEPLVLEVHIEPQLIDKVHAGLPADVRFNSFSKSPQLMVQGTVATVSHDLFTDQRTGASYFLARVRLTPEGMKALGTHRLQPGMPAEVVLKTGERSLLMYLLHPLTKRVAAALKEE